LSKLGNAYRIRIRALEVQTAQVQGQYNRNIAASPLVATLIESGGSTAGTATAAASRPAQTTQTTPAPSSVAAPTAPATPATPAPQAYKIGDTGPAGGLIFYDKGSNFDGWRYLEVAPQSTERIVDFGTVGEALQTSSDIGMGKANTQRIVNYLQASKQTGKAAQYSVSLNYGGYKDWFLPSKDELNLLYTVWKKDFVFGGLSAGWYWSSSRDNGRLVWVHWFEKDRQYSSDYRYANDIIVRAIRAF